MPADTNRNSDRSAALSALILAVAKGNEDAFDALYLCVKNTVLATAYSVTRDLQRAEDVLQEVMVYVWKHAKSYEDISPFAWIGLIARHTAIDLQRKEKNTISLDVNNRFERMELQDTASVGEDNLTIRMAIDALDEIEAQVFILKAMAGLSHALIASVLKISIRSSRYRYRCAIRRLAVLLSDETAGRSRSQS